MSVFSCFFWAYSMSVSLVLEKLFDALWSRYKQRVPYAAQYQKMVEQKGGEVHNDHVAFRTFNCHTGAQPAGVEALARIFTVLGYEQKSYYPFEDKHLSAWHWEHTTNPKNPKIFISQLEVDRLSATVATEIKKSVTGARDILSTSDKDMLSVLAKGRPIDAASAEALATNIAEFF